MPLRLPLLLLLLVPTSRAQTCCSSPQPSQPALCSSPSSCVLRGLGNTTGKSDRGRGEGRVEVMGNKNKNEVFI